MPIVHNMPRFWLPLTMVVMVCLTHYRYSMGLDNSVAFGVLNMSIYNILNTKCSKNVDPYCIYSAWFSCIPLSVKLVEAVSSVSHAQLWELVAI